MLVVTDMDGRVVEGSMRPSSDLPTHAAILRAFTTVGGVVHTHSMYATAFAQAAREIPCLGTTHADYFHGPIPVTKALTRREIATDYELNTGHAIVRRFATLDPIDMPAVLVASHASFCWGASVGAAVDTASYLEEVAEMAYRTLQLAPSVKAIAPALLEKHFRRKHGVGAYYGQK
jgi:L-ribulose-5-phosphate 4-epimerase